MFLGQIYFLEDCTVEETISKIDAVTEQEIAGIIDNYCETDGWSTVLIESHHA